MGEVFREYSEPWEGIARSHIHSVWESTTFFLEQVLQHLTDVEVSEMLLCELLDPILEKKLDLAYSKLQELIAVYRDHPATLNHYFQENVTALRKARKDPPIEQKLHEIFSQRNTISKQDIPLLMSAMQIEETPDMNRKVAEEILDYMNAFYKVRISIFLQCPQTKFCRDCDESISRQCSKPCHPGDPRQPSAMYVLSRVGIRYGVGPCKKDSVGARNQEISKGRANPETCDSKCWLQYLQAVRSSGKFE